MFRVGRKDFDGLKRSICREERNIREKASTRHLTPIYARVYRNTTKAGNGGNGSKIWSTVGLTEFDRLRRPIGRKQRASNQGGGGGGGGTHHDLHTRDDRHTRYPHCGYTSFLTLCACAYASVYDTHHRSQ